MAEEEREKLRLQLPGHDVRPITVTRVPPRHLLPAEERAVLQHALSAGARATGPRRSAGTVTPGCGGPGASARGAGRGGRGGGGGGGGGRGARAGPAHRIRSMS